LFIQGEASRYRDWHDEWIGVPRFFKSIHSVEFTGRLMKKILTLSLALASAAPAAPLLEAPLQAQTPAPSAGVEARRKALNSLLGEQWEYTLRTSPEFASILGDKRYNDRFSDGSEKAILQDLEEAKKFLARFEAIDTTGFPEQEQLNKVLMVRDLKERIEGAKFQNWLMPVNQFSSPHLQLPQLVPLLSFTNVKDYEDYLARLKQVPRVFKEIEELMAKGMSLKLMPPKILLDKVGPQAEKIVAIKAEESPFAQPVQTFPKGISEADQKRLREAVLGAVRDLVYPSYAKFAEFVTKEYAPAGRSEPGVWSLPDGEARYAYLVKSSTTTSMTPEEIHQLGLREVARIESEMLAVAKKLGFADMKSFNEAAVKNPALHPKSRQEILDLYRKYTDQFEREMPKLFGRLPKAKIEILPTEEFREKEAAGAEYFNGTPDGSRPGNVRVNTGDFANRLTLSIETTAYHEGIPGHHLQGSIAQELPSLPPFRQQGFNVAYVEGWALYSERLGRDAGFFQDPYSFYGHLQDEMLRAIRLVADTGFHYKRWTRAQVVDFFHAHSGIEEVEVQSETDRYIAIPSQALGYKIGQLKFIELRAFAQKELGAKFDIRAFHDEVLGAGSLPMEVLDARVRVWVAKQKGQPSITNPAVR
jgi:uncharacterized protein (DUF885 family)